LKKGENSESLSRRAKKESSWGGERLSRVSSGESIGGGEKMRERKGRRLAQRGGKDRGGKFQKKKR